MGTFDFTKARLILLRRKHVNFQLRASVRGRPVCRQHRRRGERAEGPGLRQAQADRRPAAGPSAVEGSGASRESAPRPAGLHFLPRPRGLPPGSSRARPAGTPGGEAAAAAPRPALRPPRATSPTVRAAAASARGRISPRAWPPSLAPSA